MTTLSFVYPLEAALVALDIPRVEWKQYIHSQITVEAKEKVMYLMTDGDATYEDIKGGLLGSTAISFAATAEAIFGPVKVEGDKPTLRKLAIKARRWIQKLVHEAETLPEAVEKVSVGYIRSTLDTEVKTYMDLTEATCIPRYLMKVGEWERSHPEVKSIFKPDMFQTSH